MKKNENNQRKSKMKYIYIIAIIGILLDQITKFITSLLFDSVSCSDAICVQAPCTTNCLAELMYEGGFFLGFNVIPGKGIEIIKNFFYIMKVENTGGAWGIFSGNVVFLALISLFVTIMLFSFIKNEEKEKELNKLSITYYGLLFSGIIGNLIDRIFNGYVIDFLNFYIFGYDYPVFNIADIFIVVGVILMIIDVLRGEIYAYNKRKRKC